MSFCLTGKLYYFLLVLRQCSASGGASSRYVRSMKTASRGAELEPLRRARWCRLLHHVAAGVPVIAPGVPVIAAGVTNGVTPAAQIPALPPSAAPGVLPFVTPAARALTRQRVSVACVPRNGTQVTFSANIVAYVPLLGTQGTPVYFQKGLGPSVDSHNAPDFHIRGVSQRGPREFYLREKLSASRGSRTRALPASSRRSPQAAAMTAGRRRCVFRARQRASPLASCRCEL